MGMGDISLLSALKSKMFWHESRQRLLAENVANADTPGYRVRDLEKSDFAQMASAASMGGSKMMSTTATTHAGHIPTSMTSLKNPMSSSADTSFGTTSRGSEVVLEEEMMKVTSNQLDYQAAASLYSKTLGLFRTAIGR